LKGKFFDYFKFFAQTARAVAAPAPRPYVQSVDTGSAELKIIHRNRNANAVFTEIDVTAAETDMGAYEDARERYEALRGSL